MHLSVYLLARLILFKKVYALENWCEQARGWRNKYVQNIEISGQSIQKWTTSLTIELFVPVNSNLNETSKHGKSMSENLWNQIFSY